MDLTQASDDEILKMGIDAVITPKPTDEKKPEETPAPAPAAEEKPAEEAAPEGQEQPQSEQPSESAPAATPVPSEAPAGTETPPAEPEKKPEEKAPEQKPQESNADLVKYKSFYDAVTGPIKANGKEFQARSPEEVISLMQKGLDYTRKTQALAKYQKYGMMLENNGLLDEGKLDLLIAVHNKDPEAIKRFFKQNKLDPVEVDTTTEDKYKEGTHAVSDKTAKLQEAIDDLKAMDGGQETLNVIGAWDKASKEEFHNQPALLEAIHKQRISGVFKTVTAEMDRLQALGQIPSGTPFLHAYKMAGDALQAQGKLGTTNAAPKTPANAGGTPAPVVRRAANNPPANASGKSAAKAAAPTKTTPGSGKVVPNFATMSDEELLKVKL